jgi:hypothetical protein
VERLLIDDGQRSQHSLCREAAKLLLVAGEQGRNPCSREC